MPKTKKTPKKRLVNKSAFVRELPADMSAADVVAAAKKKGFKISEKYCYNIRAKAKASNGSAKKKLGRPPGKVNGSKRDAAAGTAEYSEQAFLEAALDIGLSKAEALLKNVRAKIQEALA